MIKKNKDSTQITSRQQVLQKMVDEISNLSGISRVLLDLTSKPPGTTEWE